MWQNKAKKKFQHKTKYCKNIGEEYGYDEKAHQEEYQRLKKLNNPKLWFNE